MTELAISKDLSLPAEIVTESVAILGRRGSGKSTTAIVLAEEMFAAGFPWVSIDPKGDHFGIRSDVTGDGPGLPVPVFGGLHGDVPLEDSAGAVVADLIVDENLTAVLDTSDFSKNERARFLLGFFDRLYQRHRKDPQPRHVIMEEAHEVIPQQVGREDGRLKEAAARIVLQGRAFGLGSSVCSQRSARIHKDVLTQANVLIAMQTTGPQDRKAIEAWVVEHDADRELVESLPSLKPGEGWVWAPSLLGITQRVQFRPRQTFDSGSTPVMGKNRKVATIADVDTAAIKDQMAATIERAKADDPKELRTRIKRLERDLAKAQSESSVETVEVEVEVVKEVEVPVFGEDLVIRLEEALQPATGVLAEVQERLTWATKQADDMIEMTRTLNERTARRPTKRTEPRPQSSKPHVRPNAARDTSADTDLVNGEVRLGKRERRILSVLARYPQGRTHRQIALLTGYSPKASTIGAGLSALRKAGYVGASGSPVQVTPEGIDALGDDLDPLPEGSDLLSYWRGELGARERKFLDVLLDVYPDPVSHAEMAEATGYSPDASTIGAGMSRLRGLEIADGWQLHDDFWEAIQDG